MSEIKFSIGEKVWRASYESTESRVECPDCCGKGYIRCIMGDGAEVSVDCGNCSFGFEAYARGYLKHYLRKPTAILTTITGINIEGGKVEYKTTDSYLVEQDRLFCSEQEALDAARGMASEVEKAELKRLLKKEKDTRSWAWNATYHRREIKRARQSLEYHERKLNVAAEKAAAEKARKKGAAQ